MGAIGTLLVLGGFILLLISVVLLIYFTLKSENKKQWNPKNKKWAKISAIAFAAFILGIILIPKEQSNNSQEAAVSGNNQASQTQKENAKKKTEEEKKQLLMESANQYQNGIAAFNKKDFTGAISLLNKVITNDPNYTDAQIKIKESSKIIANTLVAQAKAKAAKKNYDGAIKDFENVLNYDQNYPGLQNLLIQTRLDEAKYQEAQAELKRKQEIANYKNSCIKISYKVLNKNPDKLIGTKVRLTGKIMQIQEENNQTFMLIEVTYKGYDIWTDNVAVYYEGTINAYEDDVITLYGEVTGSFSYKSRAGWDMSVPGVLAKYF